MCRAWERASSAVSVPDPLLHVCTCMYTRITAASVDPSPGVTCLLGRAHSTLPCLMFQLHFLANYQQPSLGSVYQDRPPSLVARHAHEGFQAAGCLSLHHLHRLQNHPLPRPPVLATFSQLMAWRANEGLSPFPCVIAARLAGKITDWGFAIPRHRLPSRNRSKACSVGSNHHIHNPVATPHLGLFSISLPCRGSLHRSSAGARVLAPHLGVTPSRRPTASPHLYKTRCAGHRFLPVHSQV
jgi:hypothetical protein